MYIADLHIHSRFSMATSKQLTLPHLSGWAMCKGIHVLGTGDFTHPVWQKELRESLELDEESGFYRLKGQADRIVVEREIGDAKPPLFCLQTEISSIYKKDGKTRRIHNLVFFPTLDDVANFSRKLARTGNIESDGRPILGLDARDLLELVLETSEKGVLIPAHVWTPWYSLFGSKSGFDRIEDCFGDLTQHIFALETGLSSDPAMNRLVSALDGYALISNSDAHSGANLGREANLFHGNPTYDGMFEALRKAAKRTERKDTGEYFMGTLEIYPEEGKYHLDGHRACNVVMTPEESQARNNICPVCGKPLTIGVLHRVWELADRREKVALENEPDVHPIIPLPTVLAQIHGLAPTSKKVQPLFRDALERLGSEFSILALKEIEEISDYDSILGEAVQRIREGRIELHGGYDGEFGTISVFTDEELKERVHRSGKVLSAARKAKASKTGDEGRRSQTRAPLLPNLKFREMLEAEKEQNRISEQSGGLALDEEQEKACAHGSAPLLVLAGPGAGKTRILTERMVRLLKAGTAPSHLLALTFSRKAGEEILERVQTRVEGALPYCGTFHALAWRLLQKTSAAQGKRVALLSESRANALLSQALELCGRGLEGSRLRSFVQDFWRRRERCETGQDRDVLEAYKRLKNAGPVRFVDFCDLLEWLAEQRIPCEHVLVDEIQDLSALQVKVLEALLPDSGRGFFGIGDPDQSIYAFRGALGDVVHVLQGLWPDLETMTLKTSFRSSQKILDLACRAMQERPASGHLVAARQLSATLTAFDAPTQAMEERWIAEQMEMLLGSSSHTLMDEQKGPGLDNIAPQDIAVLVRLKAQIPSLTRALVKRGIPVQAPALELFWQDEGVQKVLSFMEDEVASQGLGAGLASIAGERASTLSPEALVPVFRDRGVLDEETLSSDAWKEMLRAFGKCGSWEKLLEHVLWLKEADVLQGKAQSVRLLTMHAAKGLEFRAVFLPGFNDGLMPHDRGILQGGEEELVGEALEEERRLLYVALTRASEAVYVSSSRKRTLYGREIELASSRFFRDMAALFSKKRVVRHEEKKLTLGSLV